jgi:phospholipid-transporting ATPase
MQLGKNTVRTSKYTVLSFLPKNLFQQFQKAPNVYFLIIMFMQMVNTISISGGKPAMAAPLSIVVAASMIKDAYEDYKRHNNDKKENDT